MITRLRSFIFDVVFWGGSVPIVLAAPVAALIGPLTLRRHVKLWLRYHGWASRNLLGIHVKVTGAIPDTPTLFVAKHQSLFETFELARMIGEPAVVMKRELAAIPLWGWAAKRYGMIIVDRDASAGALRRMLRDAEEARKAGRSVVIFPEGTRVPVGATPPMKPGFAGLYRALGMPTVTVALDSGRLWPRKGTKQAGIIEFRFSEPIAPGLPRREIEPLVHAGINALETQ